MSLSAGARLGPYQILGPIGAGGMGEVYKARDTRLDRTVAIKILPDDVSRDPEHQLRFEREARAVSALNHPNICALYDVGHQDGVAFFVMEFVDGQSLDARLRSGPMPLDQTLRYAIEIAGALDRAHSQGIVHRDLKPGNIMLAKSGAKLLDFGLVRIIERDVPVSEDSTRRDLTQTGAILGTPQYMAPEQLHGHETDTRTDIFAFGAVLYEMLTGKRAFSGTSRAAVSSAILTAKPPAVTTLAPETPPALARIVNIALEKDPDARWQHVRDIVTQLRGVQGATVDVGSTPTAPRRRASTILFAAAAVLVPAAMLAIWRPWRSIVATVSGPALQFPVTPPSGVEFSAPVGVAPFPAISPDGRHIAFQAGPPGSPSGVWVRALDSGDARPLPETTSTTVPLPFWSPDGQSIGFFFEKKLKRINLDGSALKTLTDVDAAGGGSWALDGTIVYSDGTSLFRIASTGGTPAPVSKVDAAGGEASHELPSFLPDGRRFLFFLRMAADESWICAGSLDSPKITRLFRADGAAMYAPPGYVLFIRESQLLAQPFDADHMRTTGEPVSLASDVRYNPYNGRSAFSVSTNGVLVYRTGGASATGMLAWYNADGTRLTTIGDSVSYRSLSLSADNRFLVAQIHDQAGDSDNLWRIDLDRGTRSRVTVGKQHDRVPVLSPDGEWVIFASDRAGPGDLYKKRTNGLGADEIVLKSPVSKHPDDWSAHWIVYSVTSGAQEHLWIAPSDGSARAKPYTDSSFSEDDARVSPDERWIAYVSTESGRREVYVRSLADPNAGVWRVSTEGGVQPRWWADSQGLYYMTTESANLISIPLSFVQRRVEPGVSKQLFRSPGTLVLSLLFAPSRDGTRFLIPTAVSVDQQPAPLTVIVNWPSLLPRR